MDWYQGAQRLRVGDLENGIAYVMYRDLILGIEHFLLNGTGNILARRKKEGRLKEEKVL
jgi:hypothetical protein